MARKFEEQKAKPSNDAYTGMLVISFTALLIGCGLLYMDYSQYDNKPPPKLSRDKQDLRPTPESEAPKKAKVEPEEKDTPPDDVKDKGTEKKDTEK
jgi:hypothetical protein